MYQPMNFSKKIFRSIVFFSLTLLACCAPPYVYTASWQGKPVVIDGQTNDWEVPLRFFDEKTRLNYTITNDADNLYICVRATDDENVNGITRRGLQLWIDTTGKKGKQVGILFPVIQKSEGQSDKHKFEDTDGTFPPAQESESTTSREMPDTIKENRKHRAFVENAKEMRVKGFATIPDGLVEVPNTYGLNLAVSWNKYNVLVFEASIPLKAFLKRPIADSLKTLGISFNFTVMPKRTPGTGGGGHGGGMHGGGGGMGGGMGGGGMHGGGGEGNGSHSGGSNSSDLETESTWSVFRLSTGK
jgi:hypothetical protein